MNSLQTSIIFLYSKYSDACRYLYQYVKNIEIIHKLCLDNSKIKEQILNSKINVTTVPCIALYYPTGTVELLEGQKAFEWVHVNIQPLSIFQPQQQVETTPQISSIENQIQQNPTTTQIQRSTIISPEEKQEEVIVEKKDVLSKADEIQRSRDELIKSQDEAKNRGTIPVMIQPENVVNNIKKL